MGNIYTRDIKRTAFQLYEKFKDSITVDFDKNKELVKQYVDIPSKKTLNKIAGYLTRYAKLKQKTESKEKEEESEEEEM